MMPTISIDEAYNRGYVFPNVQTVLFPKESFNRKKSSKWLKDHGYTAKYYRTTKNFIRRMQKNPVVGATYYSEKLPNGIIIVIQNIDDIDGAGLKETYQAVKKKVSEFINKYIPLRTFGSLPPRSRQLLERIRDEPITSIQIIRTPIESYINKALNLLSLGKWDQVVKEMGYDKLFHLSIFLNNKYVFHKIEVPTLSQETPIRQNSEIKNVNISSLRNNSISKFIDETRRYMGDENFSKYDPASLNCQHFITAALSANNIITPELNTFINQDAIQIFQKLPKYVKDVATTITDIGARFNRAIQGEGVNDLIPEGNRFLKELSKYIPAQYKLAKKYKIPVNKIIISPRKQKKYRIYLDNGEYYDYGAIGMDDYLIHKDDERRRRFHNRFKNNVGYNNPKSPLFYSVKLLW
jgi:hypothetical protein